MPTPLVKQVPPEYGVQKCTVAEAKARSSHFKWTADHDYAFPDVDPGIEVDGSRILVQIRTPKRKTAGGIILTADSKETELWNTQVALVRQIGALAYRNRNDMTPWPEGPWSRLGEFIRVPKWGGDRWQVETSNKDEPALFAVFKDLESIGRVTVDPLSIKAFV